MPYLPKSRERYYAALRMYINKQIFKYGVTEKQLKKLKKIMLAELLCRAANTVPVNIAGLADSLLGCCLLALLGVKKYLSTSLEGSGNYLIDPDIFTALLLELITTSSSGKHCEVKVVCDGQGINLTATGKRCKGYLLPLIKKAGAAFFHESTRNLTAIRITAKKTEKAAVPYKNEWEYFEDPLSPVHVFLSDITFNTKK